MEDPETLPGPHVEAADVPLLVSPALGRGAGQVRGADDDDVPRDDGRRVEPNLAGDQVHLLIVFELQIDDAILPEAWHRHAGLRIERDEPVAGRHVQDPLLLAVAPVREPASRQSPRGRGAARALVLGMHPQQLAGGGVERHDGPPVPAVEYSTPFTISGVDSRLNSGRGPRLSVLNRHATWRLLKLSRVIWSSGE